MSDVDGKDEAAPEDAPKESVEGGEAEEQDEAAADRASDADEVVEDVVDTEAIIAELKDKLLRALAETENVRRRATREADEARKYSTADFARDMLVVSDNLRRALDALPEGAQEESEALASLLAGVELTEKGLLATLAKNGIESVDPLGEKLNPNLHQAVMQVDDTDAEAGTVVRVLQTGYTIHGRLLRPAMVGVAKGNGKANGADNGNGGNGKSNGGKGEEVDTTA